MATRADRSPTRHAEDRVERRPCIEITPSSTEYRQLCRDLAALRAQGAASNTSAILDAVHRAAKRPILGAAR
jgi:hypothetical protein